MRKLCLLLYCIMLIPFTIIAQEINEYNRKGDEAMERKDYADARLWYGEGVDVCDMYSIHQLTTLWLENQQMRLSMRSLMSKCLNCLTVKGNENDATAITLLVEYYKQGIGTSPNRELTTQWNKRLEDITKGENMPSVKPREPMQIEYFVGYHYSIQAPFGINAGMIFNRMGFYVRYKTNLSFQDMDYTYVNGSIQELSGNDFYRYNKKKVNYFAVSGGLAVKCTPWLYTSIGAGYFDRELIYSCDLLNDNGTVKEQIWSKNKDKSYKGVIADVDFMFKIGSNFYISAGVNTLKFKYVDLNAGVGLFF